MSYDDEPSAMGRIAELERKVEELQLVRRLTSSSIGSGGLVVKDGGTIAVEGGAFVVKDAGGNVVADLSTAGLSLEADSTLSVNDGTLRFYDDLGNTIVFLGQLTVPAGKHGFIVQDPTGLNLLDIFEAPSGDWLVNIRDGSANQNAILVNDTGGEGLARPYLSYQFVQDLQNNELLTTSATYQNLWRVDLNIQHPELRVDVYVRSTGGSTTGNVRVYDETAGVVLATAAIAGSAYTRAIMKGPFPTDAWGEWHDIRVQGRRTAGAGNIGIEVVGAYGVQS